MSEEVKPATQKQSYSYEYGKTRHLEVKTELGKVLDKLWSNERVFVLKVEPQTDNTLRLVLARADSKLVGG